MVVLLLLELLPRSLRLGCRRVGHYGFVMRTFVRSTGTEKFGGGGGCVACPPELFGSGGVRLQVVKVGSDWLRPERFDVDKK